MHHFQSVQQCSYLDILHFTRLAIIQLCHALHLAEGDKHSILQQESMSSCAPP